MLPTAPGLAPRLAPRLALRPLALPLTVLLVAGLLALLPARAAHAAPVEDYASYQAATNCSPQAKPGTKVLGRWMVNTFGGGFGPISRACSDSTSEHEEGRAFDWMLDAAKKADRRKAQRFLTRVLATDERGNEHALARRMGIMYVIWNDHIWRSYGDPHFDRGAYLSSSCPSRKRCSKTLRHRDHVHVSLSRAGGKGRTSWYDGRLD